MRFSHQFQFSIKNDFNSDQYTNKCTILFQLARSTQMVAWNRTNFIFKTKKKEKKKIVQNIDSAHEKCIEPVHLHGE